MTTKNREPQLLPGLDVVGRGIYLRPHQPYELKAVLFKQDGKKSKFHSRETDQIYDIPEGYEVNESPPAPAKQALNTIVLEESWERFDKEIGLDTSLAMGVTPFSVNVTAGQTDQLRNEEDAYYGLRNSFIPFWTVYIPNLENFEDDSFGTDLPDTFDHARRNEYERFFERYGTHYVRRAWVGGKAMLAFSVVKSSNITKQELLAGMKASYGPVGSGGMQGKMTVEKEKLQTHSQCTVFGKGGDELKLAALSSLDDGLYNEWLKSIKDNPGTIELEVMGIWTLVKDSKKAQALMDAYREATAFRPISSVVTVGGKIYFVRGNKCFCYHIEQNRSEKPKPISEIWPALSQFGFHRLDAIFRADDFSSKEGENLTSKLYFFRRDKYLRIDVETGGVDDGFPRKISEGWPGVNFERIDAALDSGTDSIYLFCGDQYVRYSKSLNRADEGYPEPIRKRWAGLTFDRIDGATYWGNGKVYFFRGDQHIRYDMVTYRADPGYPKFVIGQYVEDWKFFD
ncbi:MAG: hypothetical protein JEZ12_14255 [Desulfobacterium sp.]|nr:hypothetical protein [Desulfobacterium sp.]